MTHQQNNALTILADLEKLHFEFCREEELKREFDDCVLQYQVGRMLKEQDGTDFETRGVLMTGASRLGKTTDIKKILTDFNRSELKMIDGLPAKIITCNLSGTVTWKTLGIRTLKALGYEIKQYRTMEYIWGLVTHQMRQQGVIGIHYDECQHAFKKPKSSKGETSAKELNRILLDSFKTLMKDPQWPVILILSGVPELSDYIAQYGQLDDLLNPVHFDPIDLEAERQFWTDTDEGMQLVTRTDQDQLLALLYAYFDRAGFDFEPLANQDFLDRLVFACVGKWGLVIELVIAVLSFALMKQAKSVTVQDFVFQFSRRSRISGNYSPFTHKSYRQAFDPKKILEAIEAADQNKKKKTA